MQSQNASTHLPTIGQVALSGLGLLVFGFGFVLLTILGWMSASQGEAGQPGVFFNLAWTAAVVALLMLPSLFFAIRRLLGRTTPVQQASPINLWIASFGMIVWAGVLWAGSTAAASPLASFLLPPLQILAVGLPLWWLIEIARRGLNTGSPQRSWGTLNFSLLVTPVIILIIEIVILVAILVLAGMMLGSQPGLARQMQELYQRMLVTNPTAEQITNLVDPLLSQPVVIFFGFAFMSVLIPLVEEFFKPLAVFLLAGRNLTPSEGFFSGVLCGAAFALLESLGAASSVAGSGWTALILGRLGTGMLHVVTAGLMGRALAVFWQDHRYGKLALTYLGAVCLHGVWNVFGLLLGISPLLSVPALGQTSSLQLLGSAAPFALGLLMVILFSLLALNNAQLRALQPELHPGFVQVIEPVTPASESELEQPEPPAGNDSTSQE